MLQGVWKNMFEGGSLWAGVISGGLAQLQDTVQLKNGKLKPNDYAVSTTKNVTTALGTMAGVELGAVLGTAVLPGIGTAVGSIMGGLMGDKMGSIVGVQAGHLFFTHDTEEARNRLPVIQ